ncbi:MAG: ABC transporter ATP-binding protein [Crenarchaeota archaeon]|nr:ABC transporter ATP-binding protein [Thermoproteota archaeon]
MIVAEGVTVELGGREVLKEVSVRLERGRYWVLGPNGAGKTVLLKTLAFLIRPKRGKVTAFGKEDARGEVVYVPSSPPVLRGTVEENLLFGVEILGRGDPYWAAEALGIEGLLKRKAKELSSGQRALVALARALAVKPRAVLVDETLSYLDEDNRSLALKALEAVEVLAVASHSPLEGFRVLKVKGGRVEGPLQKA